MNELQTIYDFLGRLLGWYVGGTDGFVYALIIFIAVDYITGVLCAVVEKNLSSKIGARGIVKKIMIMLLVGVAHLLDIHLFNQGTVLRTVVISFYMANEGLSILENAISIGLPVPQKLKDVLASVREKNNKKEEK